MTKEHVKLFAEGLDYRRREEDPAGGAGDPFGGRDSACFTGAPGRKDTESAGEPEETGRKPGADHHPGRPFSPDQADVEAVGCEVAYLRRLSMGSLTLDEGLTPGGCRRLTEREVEALKEETGC